jgi:shikimate dehydrogenase
MSSPAISAVPRACIIGHPVKHSRSPLVHEFWLKQYGLQGDYVRAEVMPEDFESFVRAMADQGYVGGNATIPHKPALIEMADHATDRARACGAANTLWFQDRKLYVDNTDIDGFVLNLDQSAPDWDHNAETALVLGAGGASRAILYGLQERGFERIIIANRTRSNADELVAAFPGLVEARDWAELPRLLPDADLLVNTTSLGMVGQPRLELDVAPLPAHAVVTDAVYVPLETDLLARARLRGLRTVDGLGMLLHQAVKGFSHWFGQRPEVTAALHAHIAADLDQGH